jgi:tripartite-type tricarboxylate transporter receptor subunit TctC
LKAMKKMLLWCCVLLLCMASVAAGSQNYPTKPIRVVIPAAPGGSTDILGRIVGNAIEKYLGQPFVIVNISGAGGVPATSEVLKSKPDGYTLLLFHTMISTAYHTGVAPYNHSAFEPVCRLAVANGIVVVKSDAPWDNINEFADDVRRKPGEYIYAMGSGGTSHFLGVLLNSKMGLDLRLVDVGSGANRIAALEGRHAHVIYEAVGPLMQMLEAGEFKCLGVLAEERDSALPDVPTFREQGHDIVFPQPFGIFAPKGLPKDVSEKLQDALQKVLLDEEVAESLTNLYYHTAFLNSEEYGKFLEEEDALIEEIAREIDAN